MLWFNTYAEQLSKSGPSLAWMEFLSVAFVAGPLGALALLPAFGGRSHALSRQARPRCATSRLIRVLDAPAPL